MEWYGTDRINLDKPVLYVAQKRSHFARFRVESHLPPPRRARCDSCEIWLFEKRGATTAGQLGTPASRRHHLSKISLGFLQLAPHLPALRKMEYSKSKLTRGVQ